MDTNTNRSPSDLIDLMWAIVLVQAALLVVVAIESLLFFAFAGPAIAVPFVLTTAATVLAFFAGRGLRRRRRWARRVTLWSEWGLIVLATLDLVLTMILASTLPGLVPLIVGFVLPITMLRLLRRSKGEFVGPSAEQLQTEPEQRLVVEPARFDALV